LRDSSSLFKDTEQICLTLEIFMKLLIHIALSFLIIRSKIYKNLTMTKPRVSTVVHDNDDSTRLDEMFAKLDLAYGTTAKEASKIADAKEASL
jgi:hypothetical protein